MGNVTNSLVSRTNAWLDGTPPVYRSRDVADEQLRQLAAAAEVLVVGPAGAGKSALIERLVFDVFYGDERTVREPSRKQAGRPRRRDNGAPAAPAAAPAAVSFDQAVLRPVAEEEYTFASLATPVGRLPVKIFEYRTLNCAQARRHFDGGGAVGVLLLYDSTGALDAAEADWPGTADAAAVLVGSKIDLPSHRRVAAAAALQAARRMGVAHCHCSALLPYNVQHVFATLLGAALCRRHRAAHPHLLQPSPSPLAAAAAAGDVPRVQQLLGTSAANQQCPLSGRSPLSLAVLAGAAPVVHCLLQSGAVDCNQRDAADGCTPLLHALRDPDTAVVDALLSAGADPDLCACNEPCADWRPAVVHSPLSLAVERGALPAALSLLHAGCSVRPDPIADRSPLLAAFGPHPPQPLPADLAPLLRLCLARLNGRHALPVDQPGFAHYFADLVAGAGLSCTGLAALQPTLLTLAVIAAVAEPPSTRSRAWHTAHWLLANGASPHDPASIFVAVDRCRVDVLQLLASHGGDLNACRQPHTHTTPLILAALRAHQPVVDYLRCQRPPRLAELCFLRIVQLR